MWKGIIVEESLKDILFINSLKIIKAEISEKLKWHMYTVEITEEEIKKLSKQLKPKWYAHFWKGREVIAVFSGKTFRFNYDNKDTWKPVIDYGLSLNISREQLDFPIENL